MNYEDQLVQIGDLEVLATSPSGDGLTVVLFHGYGADAADLFPLSQFIKAPPNTRWIFPNGTLEVPVGPGWMGRAWFPIDMVALEQAMASGKHRDFSQLRPPGFDEAHEKAMTLFKELNVPKSKLIVGGFSQGAMVANDLLFNGDLQAKTLITLSGALVSEDLWVSGMKSHQGLKYFQSHGKNDPLLSLSGAQKLNEHYRNSGFEGEYVEFQGGHEIPQHVLAALSKSIR